MSKEQGLSLTDIGAPHIKVSIGDKQVDVYGLSVENLIALLQRFPEAGKWLAPGTVNMTEMIAAAPKLLSAIIATATGAPEDKESEAVASKLSVEIQLDILDAVVKLTFKDGFGPFVKRIADLSVVAASVNFGRVTGTNSPQQSSPSLPPDTEAKPSGK
jgi:hypothetical protein